jgi:hypothetical protein
MRIKEVGTEAELLTIERPCACGVGPCKCCCYQSAKFRSGGVSLGSIEEDCYYCVYSFQVKDGNGQPLAGAAFVRTFAPKAIPAHATVVAKSPFGCLTLIKSRPTARMSCTCPRLSSYQSH